MSKEYTPIRSDRFPKRQEHAARTQEEIEKHQEKVYWEKFKTFHADDEDDGLSTISSAVTCVHYALPPNRGSSLLAVTTGSRIMLFDGETMALKRTFNRMGGAAYSGQLRHDGALLASGCEDGVVQIFNIDIPGSTVLRQFTHSKSPTPCVRWSSSRGNRLLSTSDDRTSKVWDLSSEVELLSFRGHEDYVRSACALSTDQWATGSYDHHVRVWDERSGQSSIMSFDHGAPVEAVFGLPGGTLLLSAGGDTVKVWDILMSSSGKSSKSTSSVEPVAKFSNHQKTITSLCVDGEKTRILSASLDGHVKVYDMKAFEVVAGFKMPGPILSMSICPDNSRFACGLVNARVCVKERPVKAPETLPLPRPFGGTRRYFVRGRDEISGGDDLMVSMKRAAKLGAYDRLLKSFKYQDALDAVLETRSPPLVASMFEELANRGGIEIALSGRDEASLEPILAFLVKYTTNPRYSRLLGQVCHKVLDIYGKELGQSATIDALFAKLARQLKQELTIQKDLSKLVGTLDLFLSEA